ncbi:hypothetical protein MHBO_000644 [Bonamia ostreae]
MTNLIESAESTKKFSEDFEQCVQRNSQKDLDLKNLQMNHIANFIIKEALSYFGNTIKIDKMISNDCIPSLNFDSLKKAVHGNFPEEDKDEACRSPANTSSDDLAPAFIPSQEFTKNFRKTLRRSSKVYARILLEIYEKLNAFEFYYDPLPDQLLSGETRKIKEVKLPQKIPPPPLEQNSSRTVGAEDGDLDSNDRIFGRRNSAVFKKRSKSLPDRRSADPDDLDCSGAIQTSRAFQGDFGPRKVAIEMRRSSSKEGLPRYTPAKHAAASPFPARRTVQRRVITPLPPTTQYRPPLKQAAMSSSFNAYRFQRIVPTYPSSINPSPLTHLTTLTNPMNFVSASMAGTNKGRRPVGNEVESGGKRAKLSAESVQVEERNSSTMLTSFIEQQRAGLHFSSRFRSSPEDKKEEAFSVGAGGGREVGSGFLSPKIVRRILNGRKELLNGIGKAHVIPPPPPIVRRGVLVRTAFPISK